MVQTGRDDGQALGPNVALKIHIEYAGKETIAGVTYERISGTIFFNGALAALFTNMDALPGGTWIFDLAQSDVKLKMLGQFTGNTAGGSYEISIPNPDPPYNWVKAWGTWTAAK
jgi:hypothetical protein